jgi:hypothetical protein
MRAVGAATGRDLPPRLFMSGWGQAAWAPWALLPFRASPAERRAAGLGLTVAAGSLLLALLVAAGGKDYVLARNLLPALTPLLAAAAIALACRGSGRLGLAIGAALGAPPPRPGTGLPRPFRRAGRISEETVTLTRYLAPGPVPLPWEQLLDHYTGFFSRDVLAQGKGAHTALEHSG